MRRTVALLLALSMLVAIIPTSLTGQVSQSMAFGGVRISGQLTGRVEFRPGDIDGDRVVGSVEFYPDPIAVHIPLTAIAGLQNPIQFTFNNIYSWTLDRWGHGLQVSITAPDTGVLTYSGRWTSFLNAPITNWHSFGTSVGEVYLPDLFLNADDAVQSVPGAYLTLTVMVRPFYDANDAYHWKMAQMSLIAVGGGGTLIHQVRTLLQGQPLVGVQPAEPDISDDFADCFEAVIRELIGRPTGPITQSDIAHKTHLNLAGRVNSLEGINHFTNLVQLQAQNNPNLTGINLNHQSLPHLENLVLQGSGITSIDLYGFENLTHINVAQGGSLASLTLNNLPNLRGISVSNNGLTELNLTNLPSLRMLVAQNNQIPPSLDLREFESLVLVDLRGNDLSENLVYLPDMDEWDGEYQSRPNRWQRPRVSEGFAF